MYEVDIAELTRLIQEGRVGADYAWANRDTLSTREHTYTLYGPYHPPLGAIVPCSLTPPSARKLRKSTRRKSYIVYELDSFYKPLRLVYVIDNKVDCVDHCFELKGITYVYSFGKYGRRQYSDRIHVLKHQNGKPIYFADTTATHIFAEFYEYIEPDGMGISCYGFATEAKYTKFGYPVDWNAPIGAENSPVSCHYREEPVQYIDFSHWFEEK